MKTKVPLRTVCLVGVACLMALWIVWDMQNPPKDAAQNVLSARRVIRNKPAPERSISTTLPAVGGNAHALSMREPVEIPNELTDLFRPHSWVMFKAPVVEVVVEPPKPTAPPVPYVVLGRLRDVEGKEVTYLKREGDLIPISVGKVLHGVYQVEAITPTEVVVTYLPLAERQLIPMGSTESFN